MKHIKSNLIFTIVLAGILALSVSLTAFAVIIENGKLNKTAKNKFVPADVDISVTEEFDPDEPVTPNVEKQKVVQITNSQADESYIRVKLVPRWIQEVEIAGETVSADVPSPACKITETDAEGNEKLKSVSLEFGDYPLSITGNTFTMGETVFRLDDNWSQNWLYVDGTFYYKRKAAKGETTPILLQGVTLKNKPDDDTVTLQIDVIADSVQTDGGAIDNETAGKPANIDKDINTAENSPRIRWDDVVIASDGTLKAK